MLKYVNYPSLITRPFHFSVASRFLDHSGRSCGSSISGRSFSGTNLFFHHSNRQSKYSNRRIVETRLGQNLHTFGFGFRQLWKQSQWQHSSFVFVLLAFGGSDTETDGAGNITSACIKNMTCDSKHWYLIRQPSLLLAWIHNKYMN